MEDGIVFTAMLNINHPTFTIVESSCILTLNNYVVHTDT